MQSKIIHTDYSLILAINIQYWENGKSLLNAKHRMINPWQGEFLYKNKNVLLENVASKWRLFLNDERRDWDWFLNEYLPDLQLNNLDFPAGGIVFFDRENRDLIPTNYDVGESEEWKNILGEIKSNGEVTYTFSATDKAIDIKISNGDIYLQTLSWEATPNRLESSREIQPVHVFKGSNFFLSQIADCVNKIKDIYAEIEKRRDENRDLLMCYFSVTYRRSGRESQDDWIDT